MPPKIRLTLGIETLGTEIAPGIYIYNKTPAYWEALHLRDKVDPNRDLKSNPFTQEEILLYLRDPKMRLDFENLYQCQQDIYNEAFQEHDHDLEEAIKQSLLQDDGHQLYKFLHIDRKQKIDTYCKNRGVQEDLHNEALELTNMCYQDNLGNSWEESNNTLHDYLVDHDNLYQLLATCFKDDRNDFEHIFGDVSVVIGDHIEAYS